MIYTILVDIFGILIFLFLYWRRLKEDYISNIIFISAFYSLIGLSVFYALSKYFLSQWWFWSSFIGLNLGFFISVRRFRLRFYESFETLLASITPWFGLLFFADSIKSSDWFSFGYFLLIVATLFTYRYLSKAYKGFSWYRSGRVGFAGLTTYGIFFLVRGVIAIFFPFMLSFVRGYEAIISGLVAFLFFLMIYNLSRN
jgi:hypothetical protein